MSDAGSERPPDEAAFPAFEERDDAETRMPFGSGGVPFYISILWIGFVVVYITVMSLLALPDLRAWLHR
jgi:hypothetical protein